MKQARFVQYDRNPTPHPISNTSAQSKHATEPQHRKLEAATIFMEETNEQKALSTVQLKDEALVEDYETFEDLAELSDRETDLAEIPQQQELEVIDPLSRIPDPRFREVEWKQSLKELTGQLANAASSREELLRQKFNRTPPSKERLIELNENAKQLIYILNLPHTPSVVMKKQKLHLMDEDTDLRYFLSHNLRNEKSYNRYIRGVAERGLYEAGLGAISDMKYYKIPRSVMTYTNLMVALARMGGQENRLREVLVLMKDDAVQPNIHTYSVMVEVILSMPADKCYHRISEDVVDRAFDMVELIKRAGLSPTLPIFTSLVKGCLRSGDVSRAWATYDHMRVWHCEPDTVMFSLMIHACGITGETERALQLLQSMQTFNCEFTEVTYNSLIKAFGKRPDMYSQVFQFLTEMRTTGYAPNIKTYRHLLLACSSSGDIKTAELVFDELMRFEGQDLTAYPYAVLVNAYAASLRVSTNRGKKSSELISQAEKIWDLYLKKGLQPNVVVMNSVLKVYAVGLRINRALMWREKYAEYGIQPNFQTYDTLIMMFSRSNRMERAFDMFNLLKADGFKPSLKTYANLIFGCGRKFYVTSGLRLLRELKEQGLPLEPHFHFVINFRRNCVKTPHVIKEIDELTGKAYQFVPFWKKPGGRKPRNLKREVTKKEAKKYEREPKWVSPGMVRRPF